VTILTNDRTMTSSDQDNSRSDNERSAAMTAVTTSPPEKEPSDPAASGVIPVVAEDLKVERRQIDLGAVRVRKTVEVQSVTVDEPVMRDEVVVSRKPLNLVVDPHSPPLVRQIGDTTIVPVLEEQLVLEKRWMLKEEIHITRVRREIPTEQVVELRNEQAQIEHVGGPESGASSATRE